MAEFNIVLNGKVDADSVNRSLKKIEKQINPINIKAQTSNGKSTSGGIKKDASSTNIEAQMKRASRATADFNTKLKNLKTTGGLTEKQFTTFSNRLTDLKDNLSPNNIEKFNEEMHTLKNEVSEASTSTKAMGQSVTDIIGKFTKWYLISGLVTGAINLLKKSVVEVVSIDTALLEVSKVSDLTADQLEIVKNKAFEVGKEIGRTGTDVLEAVATFKRAGYTIQESFDLAKTALVMTNVADGIENVEAASSSLISILRGFKMDASKANYILDVLNNTSNNFAVDAVNLTDIMERVSGTVAQTGTSFEELTGLATAAFGTLRNAEMVASGINMITQRMKGMTEAGEENKELVPKIEEALQKYTQGAVSMIDKETGGLRSTYDVLQDLSKVYDTLDDNARAYLNEVIAGNRQNKVLVSIMESWEEVEEVVKSTSEATGSASEENEKYLDSIKGGIEGLKSAFQELADRTISSDFVKSLVKAAQGIVNFITKIGGLKTVLIGLISVITILKAQSIATFVTTFAQGVKTIIMLIPKLFALTAATKAQTAADTAGAVAAGAKNAAMTAGIAAIGIAAGVAAVTAAIISATKSVDTNIDTFEEQTEVIGETIETLTEYEKALNKLKNSLSDINNDLEKNISLLKEEKEEYKKEKELQEKLLDVEQKRQALAEARQKKVRIFRAGIGFTYTEDTEAVQEAQTDLQKSIEKLSEYKYELAYDRAKEFVEKLNKLLTSGNIVEGWDSLFTEFSDLLDSQFASYLTEAQKFVDKYNKTLEKLNAISPEEQAEANEAYNKTAYDLSQKRKEQQSYALTSEEQEFYQASKYNEEFKRQYENLPEWNIQKKAIRNALQSIEDKLSKYDVASKEVEELEKKLASMPKYAGGTSNSKDGISSTGEHGWEMMNLPKGTEILSHQNSVRLSSIADNPAKYFSNATRGQTILQFNGPLNFPNVRTAEDANGFISEITNLGISKIPQL